MATISCGSPNETAAEDNEQYDDRDTLDLKITESDEVSPEQLEIESKEQTNVTANFISKEKPRSIETLDDLMVNIHSQNDTGAAGLLVHEYMSSHELSSDDQLTIMAALSQKIHRTRICEQAEVNEKRNDGNSLGTKLPATSTAENRNGDNDVTNIIQTKQTVIEQGEEGISQNTSQTSKELLPTTYPFNSDQSHLSMQPRQLKVQQHVAAATIQNAALMKTSTDHESTTSCNTETATSIEAPTALPKVSTGSDVGVSKQLEQIQTEQQLQINEKNKLYKHQKQLNKMYLIQQHQKRQRQREEQVLQERQQKLQQEKELLEKQQQQKSQEEQLLKEQQQPLEEQLLKPEHTVQQLLRDQTQKFQVEERLNEKPSQQQLQEEDQVKEQQQILKEQLLKQKLIEHKRLRDQQQKLQEEQKLKEQLQLQKFEEQQLKQQQQLLDEQLQKQKLVENKMIKEKQQKLQEQQDIVKEQQKKEKESKLLLEQKQQKLLMEENNKKEQLKKLQQQQEQNRLLNLQKEQQVRQMQQEKLKELQQKFKVPSTTSTASNWPMKLLNPKIKLPEKQTLLLPQWGPIQQPSHITTETQSVICTSVTPFHYANNGKVCVASASSFPNCQQLVTNTMNLSQPTQQSQMLLNSSIQYSAMQPPPANIAQDFSVPQVTVDYNASISNQAGLTNMVPQQPTTPIINAGVQPVNIMCDIASPVQNQTKHQQPTQGHESAIATQQNAYYKAAWAAYYASIATVNYAKKQKKGQVSVDDYAAHCLKYYREQAQKGDLLAAKPAKPPDTLAAATCAVPPPETTPKDMQAFKTLMSQPPPSITRQQPTQSGTVQLQPQPLPYQHMSTVTEATEPTTALQEGLKADYAAYYKWMDEMQKQQFKSFEEQNNFNKHATDWHTFLEQRALALKNADVARIEKQFYGQSQCHGSFSKPTTEVPKLDVSAALPPPPPPPITAGPTAALEPNWSAVRSSAMTINQATEPNIVSVTTGYPSSSSVPGAQQTIQADALPELVSSQKHIGFISYNNGIQQIQQPPVNNTQLKQPRPEVASQPDTQLSVSQQPAIEERPQDVRLVANYEDDCNTFDDCDMFAEHSAVEIANEYSEPQCLPGSFENSMHTDTQISLSGMRTTLWNQYQNRKSLSTSSAKWERYLANGGRGPWPPVTADYGGNAQEDKETFCDGNALYTEDECNYESGLYSNTDSHDRVTPYAKPLLTGKINFDTGFGEWHTSQDEKSYTPYTDGEDFDQKIPSSYYGTTTALPDSENHIPSLFHLTLSNPQKPYRSNNSLKHTNFTDMYDSLTMKKQRLDDESEFDLPTEPWIFQGKDAMESYITEEVQDMRPISPENKTPNVSQKNLESDPKVTPKHRTGSSQLSQSVPQKTAKVSQVNHEKHLKFKKPLLPTTPKSIKASKSADSEQQVNKNIVSSIEMVNSAQQDQESSKEKLNSTLPSDKTEADANSIPQAIWSVIEDNGTDDNGLDSSFGQCSTENSKKVKLSQQDQETSKEILNSTLPSDKIEADGNSIPQAIESVIEVNGTDDNELDSSVGQCSKENSKKVRDVPSSNMNTTTPLDEAKPTTNTEDKCEQNAEKRTGTAIETTKSSSMSENVVLSVTPTDSKITTQLKPPASEELKESEVELESLTTSTTLAADDNCETNLKTVPATNIASYDELFLDALPEMLPSEQKQKLPSDKVSDADVAEKSKISDQVQVCSAEFTADKQAEKLNSSETDAAQTKVLEHTSKTKLKTAAPDEAGVKKNNSVNQRSERQTLQKASSTKTTSRFKKSLFGPPPTNTYNARNYSQTTYRQTAGFYNEPARYEKPYNMFIPQQFACSPGHLNQTDGGSRYAPGNPWSNSGGPTNYPPTSYQLQNRPLFIQQPFNVNNIGFSSYRSFH